MNYALGYAFTLRDLYTKFPFQKLKLYYYRQVTPPNLPNNQEYAAG